VNQPSRQGKEKSITRLVNVVSRRRHGDRRSRGRRKNGARRSAGEKKKKIVVSGKRDFGSSSPSREGGKTYKKGGGAARKTDSELQPCNAQSGIQEGLHKAS